ncbi:malonyl-CoA O-methyltransferase [Aeromonas sp. BIGb0405]|uniref:malonyl-ACP O-methyltransferase BioC n=1 Tax=Aeromonas sp. BIGb0405 TaxID=2940592 RepID=UPI002167D8BD|nr:malonyl-ACP O-methyltransferase BioC [Aeromonas sp. BIGb0405]MCS3454417.1 malonyl-CoA O-methyltransferase [Aeromonas sp. BIGb0405]
MFEMHQGNLDQACEPFQRVDKGALARRFGAAAASYDAHARFQQEVGQALLARLPEGHWTAGLDLGCGTGFFLPALQQRCSQLCGLDLSPGMLAQARLRASDARLLCGDAEALPLADASLDLVFSSLALQWCERPQQAFSELKRVLRPGGQILFSTLLSGSLWQLAQAWQAVDDRSHVNRFLGENQLRAALENAGFQSPDIEVRPWHLGYGQVLALLRDLKGIGASQVNEGSEGGLGGRARLARLIEAYEAFRRPDKLLEASYSVALVRLG